MSDNADAFQNPMEIVDEGSDDSDADNKEISKARGAIIESVDMYTHIMQKKNQRLREKIGKIGNDKRKLSADFFQLVVEISALQQAQPSAQNMLTTVKKVEEIQSEVVESLTEVKKLISEARVNKVQFVQELANANINRPNHLGHIPLRILIENRKCELDKSLQMEAEVSAEYKALKEYFDTTSESNEADYASLSVVYSGLREQLNRLELSRLLGPAKKED